MNGYRAEHDDVLFSIQRVLFNEARQQPEQADPGSAPHIGIQVIAGETSPAPEGPWAQSLPRPAAALPKAPSSRPAADGEWTDPATGAGSAKALRRDLLLEHAIPSSAASGLVVLSVEVQRERETGQTLRSEALDGVLRCVTQAARGRLGSEGRVYRSERHGLTLVLRGYRGAVAELESRIEEAANQELSARGLPHVRVRVHVVAGDRTAPPVTGLTPAAERRPRLPAIV